LDEFAMIPILLHIGPLTIYSYGLMMALGFLAADLVVSLDCRRRGINRDFSSALVVWAAIFGIAGSRILDVLNNLSLYLANPKMIIFSSSGFVWYGGLTGGILAAYVLSHRWGIKFKVTADMCGPALAIGQAIGRIGCQLSGDGDWGLPSKLPWAMAYPNAIVGWNSQTVMTLNNKNELVSGYFPGVRVHPTPVYETILYTIVFVILWRFRRYNKIDGRVFYLYLVLAGASRFAVEFIRVNPRVALGLSEAQLIAMGMMIFGACAWMISGFGRARRDLQPGIGATQEGTAA
jgi:phosphatidylglycerol:prolipoprotein diacylglycerol transferase